MVNRIDNHVESAVEYTTRATNDTKKALEYQSKARRKKIMMMLCVIIAGGLGTYMGGKYLNLFQKVTRDTEQRRHFENLNFIESQMNRKKIDRKNDRIR